MAHAEELEDGGNFYKTMFQILGDDGPSRYWTDGLTIHRSVCPHCEASDYSVSDEEFPGPHRSRHSCSEENLLETKRRRALAHRAWLLGLRKAPWVSDEDRLVASDAVKLLRACSTGPCFELLPSERGKRLELLTRKQCVQSVLPKVVELLGPVDEPWFQEHCKRVARSIVERLSWGVERARGAAKVLAQRTRHLRECKESPSAASPEVQGVLRQAGAAFLEAPGAFAACSRSCGAPRTPAHLVAARQTWSRLGPGGGRGLLFEAALERLDFVLYNRLDLRDASKRRILSGMSQVCRDLDVEMHRGGFDHAAFQFCHSGPLSGQKCWGAGCDSRGRLVVFNDSYDGDGLESMRVVAASLNLVPGRTATVSGPFYFPSRSNADALKAGGPGYVLICGLLRRGTLWALTAG